ncbi:trypsin-like peptidase domain-containing protein [Sphaerospermopsis aphanizomenoides BCCUSP55]|uniref:S1 family peptidase n=1 Tax=Sphaerospermopsis aphanizomenoides TaxID=459663 RepID=UPI001905DAAA|nr:serine protease [Sphaerospermopsis aphanizomenoides]MBK1988766.1 trypsin-like peptidase domain-containing protein [Sphaerospermopsis aphanizomenoides BCCUSP55]
MNWHILKFVACIGGLSMLLSASAINISISAEKSSITEPPTQLSIEQLKEKAAAISVKILSTDFLGSGILLNKQNSVYTVLTNAHILRADDPPYWIQTPDGEIYQASVPNNVNFQDYDLAILQFTSVKKEYYVAALGVSPKVGDEVFVAGFPVQEETEEINFVFNSGNVSLVLEKALGQGYQVGYTNRLEKGMSGGALLNKSGEVVGVNGMHAYPLWDVPSIFMDGEQAEENLHQQIIRLSWAVPIYNVMQKMEKLEIYEDIKK